LQSGPCVSFASVETTVFLIRHGVTAWHDEKKLLGKQRDLPLSQTGLRQAELAAARLAGVAIGEVISSPMQRAMQTAQLIGQMFEIDVARDPRLTDLDVGDWAGRPLSEIERTPEYATFIANPAVERIPGGERLEDARRRAVGAIEQALQDSPSGDAIAIVTHASVIRLLLAHYLGSPLGNYHRITVMPGSASILRFSDDRALPRLLAINFASELAPLVGG
jgi:broad specificity phosphatase PhoE